MPVVTRPRASTETENAVPIGVVLSLDHVGDVQLVQPLGGERDADQAAALPCA